jgi:hypothetical protein
MSIRTNSPSEPARATMRSTFRYAVSSSKARPRWVSLSATFARSSSAASRSRMLSYSSTTAVVSSAVRTSSPSSVVFTRNPASFSRRSTTTHSSSVSPATNRAAPSRIP